MNKPLWYHLLHFQYGYRLSLYIEYFISDIAPRTFGRLYMMNRLSHHTESSRRTDDLEFSQDKHNLSIGDA